LDISSGELGSGKYGWTYNVIAGNTVGLAPGAHDVGIVVGEDGDLVDTLLAELGELLDVLRDVVGGADGSEGTCWRVAVSVRTLQTGCRRGKEKISKERSRTGQSEEDDLLVGELLGGVVVDGDTARGDLAGLLGPGDVTIVVSR
jgi:hypothetical protein